MAMNVKLRPCMASHQIEDETSIVTYQCLSLNGLGHTGPHTTLYLGKDGKQKIRVTWFNGQRLTRFRDNVMIEDTSV